MANQETIQEVVTNPKAFFDHEKVALVLRTKCNKGHIILVLAYSLAQCKKALQEVIGINPKNLFYEHGNWEAPQDTHYNCHKDLIFLVYPKAGVMEGACSIAQAMYFAGKAGKTAIADYLIRQWE